MSFSMRSTLFRTVLATAGTILLAGCSDDVVAPETPALFSTTYVFGASLDDTGNSCNLSPTSCPPAPYFNGRASNGPLYIELIAAKYGATVTPSRTGGTNYSYQGARTGPIAGATQGVPSMVQQVETYLAAPRPASRGTALHVLNLATVGNDINVALTQAATNPSAPATIIGGAVLNTINMINRLYAEGANHIMILNSTDIGKTPLVRAQGAAAAAGATQLSTQFNTAIAGQLAAIRAASPNLKLYVVDLGALTTQVLATPGTFGFTNVTQACVSTSPPAVCAAPDTYFYWDGFHPTAATGRLVSQRAIAVLDSALALTATR